MLSVKITGGHHEEKNAVSFFVNAVRSKLLYKDVPIILIPESVAGIDASHWEAYVRDDAIPDVFVMHECAKGKRAGVNKTEKDTNDMHYMLENLLLTNAVQFSTEFITYKSTEKKVKEMLKDQFANFQWDEKGKLHGKYNGQNDDLLISVLMIPYWRRFFMKSPTYESEREYIFGM